MSRRAPLLTALAAVLYSTAAAAHGGDDHSVGHAALRDLAGTELSFLSFDHGLTAGTLTTLNIRGEIALGRWVAGIAMPYHRLALDTLPDERHGVGDPSAQLKFQLIPMGADRLSLQLGTRIALPLGDQHEGLGAGHYEVNPFVSAMWLGSLLSWHGTLGWSESISSHTHDPSSPDSLDSMATSAISSSPLKAHANRELVGHVGSTLALGTHWFVNAVMEGNQPLANSRWDSSLILMPELGWASSAQPSDGQMRSTRSGWLVTVGSAHMVLGQRFEHRASLGFSRPF